MAMLMVALVASFAAAAMWQQWRGLEVESTERQAAQARWLLVGALDWARVILREDALSATSSDGTDNLSEPWAIPLQEAKLSTFIAALPDGVSQGDEDSLAQQVFLSGQINDLQARLNVANLYKNKQIDLNVLQAFQRLFKLLGIADQELASLTQGLVASEQQNLGAAPMPQRLSQLAWWGVSAQAIQKMSPYVTILPAVTSLNVNTASAQVLYASISSLALADAQQLVRARENGHWATLSAFEKAVGTSTTLLTPEAFSVNTHYFEVIGKLRMPQLVLSERSVLQRDNTDLKVVWRDNGSWANF
jgi:general secretion pathway protein K